MRTRDQATEGAPGKGRREQNKLDVRQNILRAAEILFRVNGYTATSMDDIARGARISRKTLFNHVLNKESIVYELVDTFIGRHMPEWLETDTPVHHDVRDILAPHFEGRLDELVRHRWLLTIAAEHTRFFTQDRTEFVTQALNANIAARTRRIQAVQAEGRMRADIPAVEVSLYYELFRDFVLRRWLLAPNSDEADLHRAFGRAMSVLQAGLAVPVPALENDGAESGTRAPNAAAQAQRGQNIRRRRNKSAP